MAGRAFERGTHGEEKTAFESTLDKSIGVQSIESTLDKSIGVQSIESTLDKSIGVQYSQ